MEFITENAILVGLAVTSGLMLLWPLITGGGPGAAVKVTPTEAVLLMNRSKVLVLDVRDKAEYTAGHIQGAKHVPFAELQGQLKAFEKQKNKPVLVYCQRGIQSQGACKILSASEFTQVHQLDGGLHKWVEAKMPIVKA